MNTTQLNESTVANNRNIQSIIALQNKIENLEVVKEEVILNLDETQG